MMMERFSFFSRPYAFGGLFAGAVLSALLMQPLRLLPGGTGRFLVRAFALRIADGGGLAGALRPVVMPGEDMRVHVIREGKEPGQGVGCLEDGTMVVVENGRRVGETLDVEVTTVLQTSAGRMIFTRIKAVESRAI